MTRIEFDKKLMDFCNGIIGSDSSYHWENHFEGGQYQFKIVRGKMAHAFTATIDALEPDEEVSTKNLNRFCDACSDALVVANAKVSEINPDAYIDATPEQRRRMWFDLKIMHAIAYLGSEISSLAINALIAAH